MAVEAKSQSPLEPRLGRLAKSKFRLGVVLCEYFWPRLGSRAAAV